MVLAVGYQGSSGFHFTRLVDQNFLYNQSNGTCATGGSCTPGVNQSPFYAAYVPTTDVHTSYNGLNVGLSKRMQHGVEVDANYTWSRSMDTASNEGPGAMTNQTNPAYPQTNMVRRTSTCTSCHGDGLWTIAIAIWQRADEERAGGLAGERRFHLPHGISVDAYDWRPSVALVDGAAQIQPTRPLGYGRMWGYRAGNSCSNSAYIHNGNFPLGGPAYFAYAGNHLPSKATGQPGIGATPGMGHAIWIRI